MALDGFNIQNRFSDRVVRPALMPQISDQVFREGTKCCPYCAAHELAKLGRHEAAGILRDRSVRQDFLAPVALSEHELGLPEATQADVLTLRYLQRADDLSRITALLRDTGLLSDGLFKPSIAARYVAQSRSQAGQCSRRSHYAHLPREGEQCHKLREHNLIVTLVAKWVVNSVRSRYEAETSPLELNQVLDGTKRRPDAQFVATLADKRCVRVAIEIQRSNLQAEALQQRHEELMQSADKVIWVFRKRGSADNLTSASRLLEQNAAFIRQSGGDGFVYLINRDRTQVELMPSDIAVLPFSRLFFKDSARTTSATSEPMLGEGAPCDRLEARSEEDKQAKNALGKDVGFAAPDLEIDLFGSSIPETPREAKQRQRREEAERLIREREEKAQAARTGPTHFTSTPRSSKPRLSPAADACLSHVLMATTKRELQWIGKLYPNSKQEAWDYLRVAYPQKALWIEQLMAT